MARFLVRQVEAYGTPDGWDYNNVWNIGEVVTKAKNERKAITAFLRKRGIVFKKNRTLIDFDGDNYTIIDRETWEPLFDAVYIPEEGLEWK